MALVVCCPCGNPIECEQLDLVVTVNCPLCRQELTLEMEDATGRTRRAILTVLEGPFWVGEKFIVPVGVDLRIGKASGNWLALDCESLDDVHCRARLAPDGSFDVADGQSRTGTWIGKQRVARGKVLPKQSFRVGDFRLRFDILSPDGTTVIAAAGGVLAPDESSFLPIMKEVKGRHDPLKWFSVNRFLIARAYMTAFAVLIAVYHFLHAQGTTESQRPVLVALGVGVVVLVVFLLAGRRVALVHRFLKYGSLAVLVLFAIIDLAASIPVPAISCLAMAAALTLLIMRVPTGLVALIGATAGLCSITVLCAGLAKLLG
ncbi:MAG: hypothetical protein DCC65_10525 [Planctomycetota bacterium]|nr:MAG: hypothetical protein DCC65_10525 [Planctomycetota bacterium]